MFAKPGYKEFYDRRMRAHHYSKKYGITVEQFEKLEIKQGGVCAICGDKPKRVLAVDHDHKTGRIRELLCNNCNALLGLAKENIATLLKMIAYLEKHL